jgi:hypothetical protein
LGFPTGRSFISSTTRQQFSGTIQHRAIMVQPTILQTIILQTFDKWISNTLSKLDKGVVYVSPSF